MRELRQATRHTESVRVDGFSRRIPTAVPVCRFRMARKALRRNTFVGSEPQVEIHDDQIEIV